MKYFGMTRKGLYIYCGGLSTIDNLWHHFTSLKITHFSDEKNPNDMTSRSLRCKICQEIFKDPKSVMTDLSAWATEGKPGRPVGLGGGCAAQLRSEVWLEISISTIKTSWKAKHVSHRIVWQKGNMDPFHSFDMFWSDADDCLLSHWSTRNGKSMGLSKSHSQLHSRWCPPYAPPGILVYNPISRFNISIQ